MPPAVKPPPAADDAAVPGGVRQRLRDGLALLFPGTCLVCGAAGDGGVDLCHRCLRQLPWQPPACRGCALPLPAAVADGRCARCLATPSPLDAVHAACAYAAPLDRLLPRYKFHRDLAAGRLVAQLMAERFAALARPSLLVPVPLHQARLRARGYDQALELARPLGALLGIAVGAGTLVRRRATLPQSSLDAAARQRNLADAFAVTALRPLPAHVALVDDVMTTGATLHAAARALRAAGVARVDAWVAARVA